MLHVSVVTILPEIFTGLNFGVTGRAISQELLKISYYNPRDWAQNNHLQVDDKPYGGGPGMVMMYQPIHQALLSAKKAMPNQTKVIYLSPRGKKITQKHLNNVIKNNESLIFLAGRYEGIDERVIQNDVDEEWSIGDFVLSGGEIAAMVFIDALARLIPGSLGNVGSSAHDSFMTGLLECPHYTRPAVIDDKKVPEVLLNGNHLAIERWRRKHSLGLTWLQRPDLISALELSANDKILLDEFLSENNHKNYHK